jgi:hypothetical protein
MRAHEHVFLIGAFFVKLFILGFLGVEVILAGVSK